MYDSYVICSVENCNMLRWFECTCDLVIQTKTKKKQL